MPGRLRPGASAVFLALVSWGSFSMFVPYMMGPDPNRWIVLHVLRAEKFYLGLSIAVAATTLCSRIRGRWLQWSVAVACLFAAVAAGGSLGLAEAPRSGSPPTYQLLRSAPALLAGMSLGIQASRGEPPHLMECPCHPLAWATQRVLAVLLLLAFGIHQLLGGAMWLGVDLARPSVLRFLERVYLPTILLVISHSLLASRALLLATKGLGAFVVGLIAAHSLALPVSSSRELREILFAPLAAAFGVVVQQGCASRRRFVTTA